MKCAKTETLISKLIDHELPQNEAAVVQSHIDSCPNCRLFLSELTALKGLSKTAADYKANPCLWTRIAQGIASITPVSILAGASKLVKIWVAMASVLVTTTGAILYEMHDTEREQPTSAESIESEIFNIPPTPENLEKITLNMLVYTNGYMKHQPEITKGAL